jgi:hypothetical protein
MTHNTVAITIIAVLNAQAAQAEDCRFMMPTLYPTAVSRYKFAQLPGILGGTEAPTAFPIPSKESRFQIEHRAKNRIQPPETCRQWLGIGASTNSKMFQITPDHHDRKQQSVGVGGTVNCKSCTFQFFFNFKDCESMDGANVGIVGRTEPFECRQAHQQKAAWPQHAI